MQNTTKYERLTERRGGLIIDKCGNCENVNNPQGCTDKNCYEIMKNRLAELEDKLENGELVSKDWHDEQVLHLQEENTRLEKRNSALLIEKDAMEANCIALQKELDGVKTIGDWVHEIHKNAVQHGWYDGQSVKRISASCLCSL